MPRVAPNLPAASDWLCERCGYTLNGLPEGGNCPECGQPAAESIAASVRQPPAWEIRQSFSTFLRTSLAIIVTPTRFFRSSTTRGEPQPAERFARIHVAVCSVLFATTAYIHANAFIGFAPANPSARLVGMGVVAALSVATFIGMTFITRIAARLTAWEAAYRGLRLPFEVVLRGLHYHAAHYLPVSLIAFFTVAGYQMAATQAPIYWLSHATIYLYVLSGEVIVLAGYLFNTYWIGMRNMMYANH